MSGATSGTLQRMSQADAPGASDTTVLLGCVQASVVDARASGSASGSETRRNQQPMTPERTRLSIGDYLTMAGWVLVAVIFWTCVGFVVGMVIGMLPPEITKVPAAGLFVAAGTAVLLWFERRIDKSDDGRWR